MVQWRRPQSWQPESLGNWRASRGRTGAGARSQSGAGGEPAAPRSDAPDEPASTGAMVDDLERTLRAQTSAGVADAAARLQLDAQQQAAWDQLKATFSGLGGLARTVALPAAVVAPALMAAAAADEQYGGAGAAVSGLSGLVGAGAGQELGAQAAGLVPGAGSRARLVGRVLGALAGGGGGAGVGGLLNAGAQGLVSKAEAGEAGIGASLGEALDAIGYRSEQDVQAAAMRRAESMPLYQEMKMAELRRKEEERAQLVENLYYQMLAGGGVA